MSRENPRGEILGSQTFAILDGSFSKLKSIYRRLYSSHKNIYSVSLISVLTYAGIGVRHKLGKLAGVRDQAFKIHHNCDTTIVTWYPTTPLAHDDAGALNTHCVMTRRQTREGRGEGTRTRRR